MLVLSRKSGERITIGQDVVITVLRSQGGKVRLGIEAPKHVKVLRAELPVEEAVGATTSVTKIASARSTDRTEQVAGAQCSASRITPAATNPQKWSILSMRQRVGSAVRAQNDARPGSQSTVNSTVR